MLKYKFLYYFNDYLTTFMKRCQALMVSHQKLANVAFLSNKEEKLPHQGTEDIIAQERKKSQRRREHHPELN